MAEYITECIDNKLLQGTLQKTSSSNTTSTSTSSSSSYIYIPSSDLSAHNDVIRGAIQSAGCVEISRLTSEMNVSIINSRLYICMYNTYIELDMDYNLERYSYISFIDLCTF